MTIEEKLKGLADGKKYRDVNGIKYFIEDGILKLVYKNGWNGATMFNTNFEEVIEIDWDDPEHDPAVIPDLWPVECWDDNTELARDYRFFDNNHKCVKSMYIIKIYDCTYDHYRAIPETQWTDWQREKYQELKKQSD